jgi:hypothetical protein
VFPWGDRNRNARLARLRELVPVPVTNAIVGIDVADSKQVVVVTDHDSKVVARRTFRCRAGDLGSALPCNSRSGPSVRQLRPYLYAASQAHARRAGGLSVGRPVKSLPRASRIACARPSHATPAQPVLTLTGS